MTNETRRYLSLAEEELKKMHKESAQIYVLMAFVAELSNISARRR